MGGCWNAVVLFLSSTLFSFAYEITYDTNMPNANEWNNAKEFVNHPQSDYGYDLEIPENSKPLFNNIFWVPPIKMEHTMNLLNEFGNSKDSIKVPNTTTKKLHNTPGQLYRHEIARQEQTDNSLAKREELPTAYDDDVNEARLEKEAELRVEEEYYKQTDASRNRRENNEEGIYPRYQKSGNADYAVVESAKSGQDHLGAGSDYGHPSYVQYREADDDHEEHEEKKKKEIHYHQHKHLHEHDHLQDHKHQHLDEHKDQHHHEHKQYDDHKHHHEAKHDHKEKAEHYHKKHADHKHEHFQEHKHDHKNEHEHKHKQEAWHEHKDKHEHHHKEDEKHHHEKKAQHDHHHHHKHEEDDKHYHNHWSEHKHGHKHHHDDKHHHDHKSDHYHQHKVHHKVRVHYKKHGNHGW